MSRNICCVPGCPVVAGDDVPLHYFPCPEKDAERLQDWVKIIGGDIASLDSSFIHKNRRICRRHFQKELLYPKSRLCKLAVPSLLLPSIDVSAVPPNAGVIAAEHNYCSNNGRQQRQKLKGDKKNLTSTSSLENQLKISRSQMKNLKSEIVRLRKRSKILKARSASADRISEENCLKKNNKT